MRIHLLGLALLGATGCSGLVDDGGNGGLTDAQITAQRLWLGKALPALRTNCASCHATGVGGSNPATPPPAYLAGDGDLQIRETLLGFQPPEVNLDAPPTSHLLTRGAHDGPELGSTDASAIIEWIKAEKAAGSTTGPVTPPLAVAKFQPTLCTVEPPDTPAAPNPNCLVNKIALDSVGAPGASVQFVIESLSGGSYMTNMKVDPGASGVFLEHPTFVTWPATPPDPPESRPECLQDANMETFCPDAQDRFQTLTLNLMGGAAPANIGSGTQTFDKFIPTDMMTIQFKTVSAFKP